MLRIFIVPLLIFCLMISLTPAAAANSIGAGKKIIYIPLDNRPVTKNQTFEVAEKLGYEMIVPPDEFLGTSATKYGEPDKLWEWLNKNATGANAAVISTDSMLYGSLVSSRKHDFDEATILNRVEKFRQFHNKYPRLPLYIFGSIMRTPRPAGSSAEPEYYKQYGWAIFNYTALNDKSETEKLSRSETKTFNYLKSIIPEEVFKDWFYRRNINYKASEKLVDMTNEGIFDYFLLGCDDNAVYSQTNLERRHIAEYGKNIGRTRFLATSGADELGILMIARAVNNDLYDIPFISVTYNEGKGGDTIPSYSNDKIRNSIDEAILAIGAMKIPAPERADLALTVNTFRNGKTLEASSPSNTIKPRRDTKTFMKIVNDYINKGYPVGIADIAFANGADNALMEQLRKNDLQFKIRSYSGWNTATNSSGFLIGAGSMIKWLDDKAINALLITRYLDEWAYQANVRTTLANNIPTFPGKGNGSKLEEKEDAAVKMGSELLAQFAKDKLKLPAGYYLENVRMTLPWSRIFESNVYFDLTNK